MEIPLSPTSSSSSLWDHCFLLAQYTWITGLFREYRPSYSDILPLESIRGHSSGSSGATVKRSLSRFSGYRSLKAKAFSTVTSYRLFVCHWVLKRYFTLAQICLMLWSPELNFPLRYTTFLTVHGCGRRFLHSLDIKMLKKRAINMYFYIRYKLSLDKVITSQKVLHWYCSQGCHYKDHILFEQQLELSQPLTASCVYSSPYVVFNRIKFLIYFAF